MRPQRKRPLRLIRSAASSVAPTFSLQLVTLYNNGHARRRGCYLVAALSIAYATLSIATLHASAVPAAQERLIGHPEARFPLKVYTDPALAPALRAPIENALAAWNSIFEPSFGRPAFVSINQSGKADILINVAEPSVSHREMGVTDVDADSHGVIRLPVKVTLSPPKSRGRTAPRQVLFDTAAHEVGHALGLPHINKPDSIMCCDAGAINFHDPAVRAAYIEARQHPDLVRTKSDLVAHYRRFWQESGSRIENKPKN